MSRVGSDQFLRLPGQVGQLLLGAVEQQVPKFSSQEQTRREDFPSQLTPAHGGFAAGTLWKIQDDTVAYLMTQPVADWPQI